MKLDDALQGVSSLAFDTAPIIYFVEANPSYDKLITNIFNRVAAGELEGWTSVISLSEVFSLYGQTGYRRIERRCLERVIQGDRQVVIAVGGGIVSEPETYNLLLANCFTVWIKALPAEHMARVVAQGDLRPMQGNAEAMEDLNRILAAREPLYRKADAILDTSGERFEHSLAKLRQAVGLPA